MAARRVTEAELARILQLVASRPSPRKRRRPGDAEGAFDEWFDGGAVRAGPDATLFQLNDGTRVTVSRGPALAITIELPGGLTVVVEQR